MFLDVRFYRCWITFQLFDIEIRTIPKKRHNIWSHGKRGQILNFQKTFLMVYNEISGADPAGHTRRVPPPPLKLEKIRFFGVKSWFLTRNTPKKLAPPPARRNFFNCPPPPTPTWNPGSVPGFDGRYRAENSLWSQTSMSEITFFNAWQCDSVHFLQDNYRNRWSKAKKKSACFFHCPYIA